MGDNWKVRDVQVVQCADDTTQWRTCVYAEPWQPVRFFVGLSADDLLDALFEWIDGQKGIN